MMAARLRDGQSRRLIILGSPGCGKTTLARLLMAELLGQLKPSDPVPVFLQFTAWDPEQYSLGGWISREICEVVPELQHKSSYGSTVEQSLISHGKVLPILDGFDAIPETVRRSVLASDDFLRLPQLILTCRTQEFRAVREGAPIADATIITPGYVCRGEAEKFLRDSERHVGATRPGPPGRHRPGPLARPVGAPRAGLTHASRARKASGWSINRSQKVLPNGPAVQARSRICHGCLGPAGVLPIARPCRSSGRGPAPRARRWRLILRDAGTEQVRAAKGLQPGRDVLVVLPGIVTTVTADDLKGVGVTRVRVAVHGAAGLTWPGLSSGDEGAAQELGHTLGVLAG
jgi:hypothetical protein